MKWLYIINLSRITNIVPLPLDFGSPFLDLHNHVFIYEAMGIITINKNYKVLVLLISLYYEHKY